MRFDRAQRPGFVDPEVDQRKPEWNTGETPRGAVRFRANGGKACWKSPALFPFSGNRIAKLGGNLGVEWFAKSADEKNPTL